MDKLDTEILELFQKLTYEEKADFLIDLLSTLSAEQESDASDHR